MARFVILFHQLPADDFASPARATDAGRTDHWDLMLDCPLETFASPGEPDRVGEHAKPVSEAERGLTTWALARPLDQAGPVALDQLAPHRRRYLEYEGPISGNRGVVTRWDAGRFRIVSTKPSSWCVELVGERIEGRLSLEQRPDRTWAAYWSPAESSASAR